MNRTEYEAIVLAPLVTPSAKFFKVKQDIAHRADVAGLNSIQEEMTKQYSDAELEINADNNMASLVAQTARKSAIELLSTGRISYETMSVMAGLPAYEMVECVKQSTIIASQLNDLTKKGEDKVTPQDIKPLL